MCRFRFVRRGVGTVLSQMQPLSKKAKLLPLYFEKLLVELDALLGANLGEIDCIYVGGGTPFVLSPQQIDRLGEVLWTDLDRSKVREFTFEYGKNGHH